MRLVHQYKVSAETIYVLTKSTMAYFGSLFHSLRRGIHCCNFFSNVFQNQMMTDLVLQLLNCIIVDTN
jgi:hypothetical protein